MSGHSGGAILLFHLIPNILPTMMVQASLNLGWAILNAAGLSYIGLGIRAPTPGMGHHGSQKGPPISSPASGGLSPFPALRFARSRLQLQPDRRRPTRSH